MAKNVRDSGTNSRITQSPRWQGDTIKGEFVMPWILAGTQQFDQCQWEECTVVLNVFNPYAVKYLNDVYMLFLVLNIGKNSHNNPILNFVSDILG